MSPRPQSPLTHWLRKVDFGAPEDCWPWLAARDRDGYGKFQHGPKGRQVHARAHRWIVEHLRGPIPSGHVVMHTCDNPPCVNPLHLRAATPRENNDDKIAKGRHAALWGMALANARKTECKRGHTLADAYVDSNGFRHCKVCGREASRLYYHRTKGTV